ncbi:MAG TPA: hypothetical protein VGR56_06080 [Nitrososphaerales archaeon]|nr:hypothetical protein [Nitrososphaerales archaeon]
MALGQETRDRKERFRLIKRIEKLTGSTLLVFITGDRTNLETRIAMDSYALIFKHLSGMNLKGRLVIFLYTPGGDTIAAYGIANLIRQFTNEYTVIIPYKALSAGTLITLGANNIIMTKGGLLSPIDPSIQAPLGPRVPIPGAPGIEAVVPVSVEDVSGFYRLAKDEWKLGDEASLGEAFKSLSEKVHPLALGAVHRAREQIAFLAKNLLSYHMTGKATVDRIVNTLSRGRFSHGYLIGKREAKNVLKLPIKDPDQELEKKINELFAKYENLLELNTPYNPEAVLGSQDMVTVTFNRAIVESSFITHVFRTIRTITRVSSMAPQTGLPQQGYLENNQLEAWVEDSQI